MIASKEHKIYQKLLKKGDGSILKAIRADKGAGSGLIAGGIVLLVFALIPAVFCLFIKEYLIAAVCIIPWILMIVLGIYMKNKRTADWLSYYMKETGFTENELKQIDRELAGPSVKLVICKSPGAATENFIYGFVTEHYVLVNGVYPYLKRLEDIIAIAYSDSTDIWCMLLLTKQDKDYKAINLFTDTARKETLCWEVIQEVCHANPDILCGQEIVCEGQHYILERDAAKLLQLYREGRTLETVKYDIMNGAFKKEM
ncbi:MAG: hypothetical protein J6J42_06685 [Lachnospiraceae bacterium]|nr:hypothetical protein [Lachnospiraceae bacterium]